MPIRHGLDVSIISSLGEPFPEYGVNTHARSKLVTAKIEARTGVRFFIAIKPEDPFPTQQNKPYGSSILTRAQAGDLPKSLSLEASDKATPKSKFSDSKSNDSVKQQAGKPCLCHRHDGVLVVHNLPTDVDEKMLKKEFMGFGELTDVRIVREGKPGRSQSFGYVGFASTASAAEARAAKDGVKIDGGQRALVVDSAIAQSASSLAASSCKKGCNAHPGRSASSPDSNLKTKPKPPPFDLIVEVFIDGRTKAETRHIIPLNPEDPYYYEDGLELLGRKVRSPGLTSGAVRTWTHDWVFTDVGIEVLLARMGVDDSGESSNPKDDQEIAGLADLLQETANVADANKAAEEQELKIGKIEIVFTRVVLGKVVPNTTASASANSLHRNVEDGHEAPGKMIGKDVTHTTSIVPPNPSPSSSAPAPNYEYEYHRIKWTPYNPSEDFYAKFCFDYTSRAKLVKWGLCDEMGVPAEKAAAKGKLRPEEGREGLDGGAGLGGGKKDTWKRKRPADAEARPEIVPARDESVVLAKRGGKGRKMKRSVEGGDGDSDSESESGSSEGEREQTGRPPAKGMDRDPASGSDQHVGGDRRAGLRSRTK